MNRLIGIIHPWGGDVEGNRMAVLPILDDVMARGDIPVFPPLMFPHLDDSTSLGRATGLEAGRHLYALCRAVEVHGEPTEGMVGDIAYCEAAGVPVVEQP